MSGWTYPDNKPVRELTPGSETTKPVVAIVSPAPSTEITALTPIVVDVTDDVAIRRSILVATIVVASMGTVREVVHDGTAFSAAYLSRSSRAAISHGYRYTVLRGGGWPAGTTLSFEVFAIDTSGNEAD